MQRIYLDTNIINHLKDETDDKLLDFLNKYGRLFIFPYSPAHFDDLIHGSLNEDAEMRLQQDIKTMDLLCGDNLVDFDKEKDMLILILAHLLFRYCLYSWRQTILLKNGLKRCSENNCCLRLWHLHDLNQKSQS